MLHCNNDDLFMINIACIVYLLFSYFRRDEKWALIVEKVNNCASLYEGTVLKNDEAPDEMDLILNSKIIFPLQLFADMELGCY